MSARPIPFVVHTKTASTISELLKEKERIEQTDLLTPPAKKLELWVIEKRLLQMRQASA